jgi:hypothetical protein
MWCLKSFMLLIEKTKKNFENLSSYNSFDAHTIDHSNDCSILSSYIKNKYFCKV